MFLGLNWNFDNLKKRQMVFEKDDMQFIVPLDPSKRVLYIDPIRDEYCDKGFDKNYQITTKEEDSINPTPNGKLC